MDVAPALRTGLLFIQSRDRYSLCVLLVLMAASIPQRGPQGRERPALTAKGHGIRRSFSKFCSASSK